MEEKCTCVKSAVAQDAPLGVALATAEETTEEIAEEAAAILTVILSCKSVSKKD